MFEGRQLLIVTKHEKEKVIRPIFEQELGVQCMVNHSLDTDLLGTFSGEVERKNDVLTTLREKCQLAMEQSPCDLIIASEGSFGPHPTIFFAHCDDELMMLKDVKNDLEIVVREISTSTNFNASLVHNEIELMEFATKAEFPKHGLILRPDEKNYTIIYKGITDVKNLKEHFEQLHSKFGKAYVETDMRANFNPTRMSVIEKVAHKLAKVIQSSCPNCQTPGFDVQQVKSGLPCEWCSSPTRSTLSFMYQCKKCNFANEVFYPHKKKVEDPMYCDYCNP